MKLAKCEWWMMVAVMMMIVMVRWRYDVGSGLLLLLSGVIIRGQHKETDRKQKQTMNWKKGR